ncbi:TPA: pyocin activator PrtN family protein [Neisseria gonorrhoeae]
MNISKEQGLLIAYGGRPYIPPREVHKDFFAHIGFNAFKASGVRCELPFPIFRLSDSRKSEYFVSVRDRRQGGKGKIGISEIPVLMQDGGIRGCGTSPLI